MSIAATPYKASAANNWIETATLIGTSDDEHAVAKQIHQIDDWICE
jgi:hypothetical protein